mgnify:FL=1
MNNEPQAARDNYGGFTFLDLRALNLVKAHHALGVHVRQQAHKILLLLLDKLSEADLHRMLIQARDSWESLEQRTKDPALACLLRNALSEYLACLQAWAAGCQLETCEHPRLEGLSALDRALLLQYDEGGCQTGFYRQADGAVILWHTEENVEGKPGDRFDALRLACFRVDGIDIYAFVYPDLLPGPAFGWRSDGYAQAVDTLHTRTFDGRIGGTLANSVCWLTLRLGASVAARDVLAATGPFYTGYALNTIYREVGQVSAGKLEFAGQQLTSERLGEEAGSHLFQANIFSDPRGQAARTMEYLPLEKWRLYRQRVYRTRRFMKEKLGRASPDGDIAFIYKMMTSHAGGDWAYANDSVQAHFLQRVTVQGSETWLGRGPAQHPMEAVLKF